MPPALLTDTKLQRLLAWLSPAFPVGAYTYSHALEAAVEADVVTRAGALAHWLDAVLRHGSGLADAVFLGEAWRLTRTGDMTALAPLAERAAAFQPAAELRLETTQQGRAFHLAVSKAWPCPALLDLEPITSLPYPVVVGVACAGHGIPLRWSTTAYLHAFAANLISAGVRLIPLGQSDGLATMATLEPTITQVTDQALESTIDDLATAVPMLDWYAMRHETQYTRLFRS